MFVISKFIKRFYSSKDKIKKINLKTTTSKYLDFDKTETFEKDFNALEILYNIWWLKPFLCLCKKSKCMSNYKYFGKYYEVVCNELDFFNIYEGIVRTRDLHSQEEKALNNRK